MLTTRRQLRQVAILITMVMLVQACAIRKGPTPAGPNADIQQIAKTLDVTAQALSVFQKTVINANQQNPKLINDQAADTLVKFSLEMNKATQEAITATRSIAQLSPDQRKNIGNLLVPIATAIDNTLKSPNLTSIQSEQLRQVLQTSLLSVQTTIASVQLILAVR